ncbi:hypothetical protein TWF788_003249 [Orbilia oligospora]|uniref:Uncharacterized protein n=1 Tax=Orbilia oligospora TaxID=2813651 RepID=A0A7C8Q0F7_ORBOL|nr:hypothetical protein TWF788_003249 [Orbilia oligospora]
MFLVEVLLNVTETTKAIAMNYYYKLSRNQRRDFGAFSDIEISFCLLILALKYDQDEAPTMRLAVEIFNNYAPMPYERLKLDKMLDLEIFILQALNWDTYYVY